MRRESSRPAAVTVDTLEDRKLFALSAASVIGIKIAKRVDVDGTTALNSNRITIAFDRGVKLLDASKIRSFGYANDLTNLSIQRKVTVGMTIERDAADPRVITITTDRLVRKGSRIFIGLGALQDGKGNDIVRDSANTGIVLTKGQNKPRYTMSNRNWRPTDTSYFTPDVFTGAPTPATANTTPSAITIRANLVTFLNAKQSKGLITAEQNATALAIFDGTGQWEIAAAVIPNANLRAGLASLVGTVGEPAISSILTKNNVTGKTWTTVEFNAAIDASAPVGETKAASPSGRLYTYVQPAFAGEPFQALGAVLAHEVMHQGTLPTADPVTGELPSSQDEEIIAVAVETIVYAQAVLVQPALAGNGTLLVNRMNERLLSMLNSGDKLFPYGGILAAPAINSPGNVFVGAKTNPGGFGDNTTVKSFENWVRREYVSRGFTAGGTPTNPTAVAILKNIVGSTGNFSLFGSDVQTFLDTRNLVLTDVAYINLANALKLTY